MNDGTRITVYTVGASDMGNGKIDLNEIAYTEPPVDSEGAYAQLDWSTVKEIDFTNTTIYHYDTKKLSYTEYTGGTNSAAKGRVNIVKKWSDASVFASVKKVTTGNAWAFSPNLFSGWKGLETAIISNKASTLSDNMFKDSSVSNVEFEEGAQVYRCNNDLFRNCDNLVSIDFPDSFTYLGNSGLFYDCDNLERVGWSVNCPAIPSGAFNSCEKLTFEIPDYITEIKSSAFNGCKAITSVVVPASVEKIGSDCWRSCSNLTSVVFEEGCSVQNIYAHTFDGCNLTEIYLPNSVKQMKQNALANNKNLKVVSFGASFVDFNLEGNASPFMNIGSVVEKIYLPKTFTADSVRADIFGDDNNPGEYTKLGPNLVIYYTGNKAAAEAIVAAAQGTEGVIINGVLANVTLVTEDEYLALKAANTLSGRYIIYDYNVCDAFYEGKHAMTGNATIKLDSYFSEIVFADTCTREGCGNTVIDDSKTIEAVFVDYGYSYTEVAINGSFSMSQFFGVNQNALAAYKEATGNTIEYGLVVSVSNNPLASENSDLIAQNKTFITAQNKFKHDYFAINVSGIKDGTEEGTKDTREKALTFCAYVIDNGKVYYLDDGKTLEVATQKSYNDILGK